MMKSAALVIFGAVLLQLAGAFNSGLNPVSIGSQSSSGAWSGGNRPLGRTSPLSSAAAAAAAAGDVDKNSKAESILDEFHKSDLTFRIVVIGNGAILETTSKLGPTSKSSISPKSGERLLTFASEDQSFEFHMKVEQVSKIAFVAAKRRVARFLTEDGTPICSLILMDSSSGAEDWFDGMVEEHGNEVMM